MTEGLLFRWYRFEELSRDQLYAVLALRQEIFIVEQASPYADLDFIDQRADHLLVTDGSALVGYARCFGPSAEKPFASFGRLVVAKARRGEALGKELVRRALARLAQGSCRVVQISAQLYLEDFYAQFGFTRTSKPYDDTGILHIDMRLTLAEAASDEARRAAGGGHMSFDDATIRFYRENAAVYVKRPQRSSVRLQAFLSELSRGAKILELGCGSGRHSAEMIAGGFDVRPTDGSPEMAAEAACRLGRPVETLRFDQLDEREEYDAVWASACLLHVPKAHLQGVLARIWRALKVGGVFYASFKEGDTDGRDTIGRYYNYPSEDWLRQSYRNAGSWTFRSIDRSEGKGFDGTAATMMHLVVQKCAS